MHGVVFLDIVLVGLLAYGFIRGLWNGFFVEIASLVALLLGVYLAIKLSSVVSVVIAEYVTKNPQSIKFLAFAVTFVAVVVGIFLLAKFFTTLANCTGMGIFNKLLGGVFGLLKMALILSLSLGILDRVIATETKGKSILYGPIHESGAWIYPSIFEVFKELRPEEPTSAP